MSEPIKTGLEQYPEFKQAVRDTVQMTISKINSEAAHIESEMRYRAQFLLEEVIAELEKRV